MDERAWRRLAERAAERQRAGGLVRYVGGCWVERGHRLDELPAALGCTPFVAWQVAVCFPPVTAEAVDAWVEVIAARFALDRERVATLARLLV